MASYSCALFMFKISVEFSKTNRVHQRISLFPIIKFHRTEINVFNKSERNFTDMKPSVFMFKTSIKLIK